MLALGDLQYETGSLAAFRWLDVARRGRSPLVLGAGVLPEYAPIRDDPRWEPFVRSLRLR